VTQVDAVAQAGRALLAQVQRVIVGKDPVIRLVLAGLLADGHILLEDYPGVAKTLLARSTAHCLGLQFARIQFTPDLMPGDITGSTVFDQRSGQFEFRPGPIFANLVLADEINRASPKTQSALLEAMQERQVTVDGVSRPLPVPFFVLATQNPIEYEGTYSLPEAQLDRFMLRSAIGYPDGPAEKEILRRRIDRRSDDVALDPVLDAHRLGALQALLEEVHVSEAVTDYIVSVVAATRTSRDLEVGASPRASLALLKLGRSLAALSGRDYVLPDDIKAVAGPVLGHRVMLRSELWARQVKAEEVIARLLEEVPVPNLAGVGPPATMPTGNPIGVPTANSGAPTAHSVGVPPAYPTGVPAWPAAAAPDRWLPPTPPPGLASSCGRRPSAAAGCWAGCCWSLCS
jgi:MoxR-like ATPase